MDVLFDWGGVLGVIWTNGIVKPNMILLYPEISDMFVCGFLAVPSRRDQPRLLWPNPQNIELGCSIWFDRRFGWDKPVISSHSKPTS